MKKTFQYITLAAMTLSLAACTQNDTLQSFNDPNAVRIHATIGTLQSRLAYETDGSTDFTNGDAIKVVNTLRTSKNEATYITDGTNWTTTDAFVWNSGTEANNQFNAWYPATASFDSFDLPTDQSDATKLAAADWMTATTEAMTKPEDCKLNLAFQHKLAKVTVNISSEFGSEYGITAPALTDVKIYTSDAAKPITPLAGTDSYTAIVTPGTYTSSTPFMTLKANDVELTVKASETLAAGSHYTFTLKVGKDKAVISGVTVGDWGKPENDFNGGEAGEIYCISKQTETAVALEIYLMATDTDIQSAVTEIYEQTGTTAIAVTTALTEEQQTALMSALAGKNVTLYLPKVERINQASIANDETSGITVIYGITNPANTAKGDVAMLDGTFIDTEDLDKLTGDLKAVIEPSGIVFWTTANSNTSGTTPATLTYDEIMKKDFPNCTHGLIVSLKDVSQSTKWQETYTSIAEWQNGNSFTDEDKEYYKPIASITSATADDSGYINYILGYQNTKLLKAYNEQCEESYKVLPVSSLATFETTNPAPANTTGWFIPSEKELTLLCGTDVDDIWNNNSGSGDAGTSTKEAMKTILTSLGDTYADIFGDNYYWSSSEFAGNEGYAFRVGFLDGVVYCNRKDHYTDYVRAVCAY